MTHDPSSRREHGPADLPPVDQVIHDARESSWHDPNATVVPPAVSAAAAATAASRPMPAAPAAQHAPAVAPTHHTPAVAAGHDSHAAGQGDALGPIDTAQWAAGLIGVLVAMVVVACFVLGTQGLGAY